jgi:hypothetical protein
MTALIRRVRNENWIIRTFISCWPNSANRSESTSTSSSAKRQSERGSLSPKFAEVDIAAEKSHPSSSEKKRRERYDAWQLKGADMAERRQQITG